MRRFASVVAGFLGVLFLSVPAPLSAQAGPNPPKNLEATASVTSVRLTWDEDHGGGASSSLFFRVYRNGGLVGSTFDEDFTDTGLTIEQDYAYHVTAIDFFGRESDPSLTVTARTRDESPPSEPKDLVASAVSGSRIDLTWKASEDDDSGVAKYYVYRDESSSPLDSTTATSYSDTGLSGSTEYTYEVSAVNLSGVESRRSKKKSARTLDGTPPSTPSALTATAVSDSRIDLSWAASSDPESGVARYYVYRNGGAAPVGSATGTSYSDTGLSGYSERTYRVAAVNGAGLVGSKSTSASARPFDGSAPSAPANLTATAGGARSIDLAWEAAADPQTGITRYLLYRNGNPAPFDSTTGRSYVDGSVQPETSYTYRVSARNGEGLEGPRSNLAASTTPAATDVSPPTAPADLRRVAAGPAAVELTWTAAEDAESGIAFYRVFRDDAMVGTPAVPGFTDPDVEVQTSYEYEIAAVNGEGLEGPRTASLRVTVSAAEDQTPPAPPSGLRVVTGP